MGVGQDRLAGRTHGLVVGRVTQGGAQSGDADGAPPALALEPDAGGARVAHGACDPFPRAVVRVQACVVVAGAGQRAQPVALRVPAAGLDRRGETGAGRLPALRAPEQCLQDGPPVIGDHAVRGAAPQTQPDDAPSRPGPAADADDPLRAELQRRIDAAVAHVSAKKGDESRRGCPASRKRFGGAMQPAAAGETAQEGEPDGADAPFRDSRTMQ